MDGIKFRFSRGHVGVAGNMCAVVLTFRSGRASSPFWVLAAQIAVVAVRLRASALSFGGVCILQCSGVHLITLELEASFK